MGVYRGLYRWVHILGLGFRVLGLRVRGLAWAQDLGARPVCRVFG